MLGEIMKPPAEMQEGPEALARFEDTMRAIFSKRKPDAAPAKQRKPAPKKSGKRSA